LPRDLADVLHYFLPEVLPEAVPEVRSEASLELLPEPTRERRPEGPPLPILGIPIGDREIVPAALLWNLAVETARLGGTAIVLAPAADRGSPLWPEPGDGPLGAELHVCEARSLGELHRSAIELAHRRASGPRRAGGLVFVRIPSQWLEAARSFETQPFRWLLLLSSARSRDLRAAYGIAEVVLKSNPKLELGVTIHGVQSIEEARQAFDRLNERVERSVGPSLCSYGLLVDDLDVYRAIAAQKPIGLAHPQAPATRALMDVARLLYEDARSRALG